MNFMWAQARVCLDVATPLHLVVCMATCGSALGRSRPMTKLHVVPLSRGPRCTSQIFFGALIFFCWHFHFTTYKCCWNMCTHRCPLGIERWYTSCKSWVFIPRRAQRQSTALCDSRQHNLLLECRNWRRSTRELVLSQWNRSPTGQYRMVVLQYQGAWCGTTAPSYWWCVRDSSLCDT